MYQNIQLIIQYCGTGYFGWQIQPNHITIQGIISYHLKKLLKHDVNIIGAGRTDTGVHAKKYIANFVHASKYDCKTIKNFLNAHLKHSGIIIIESNNVSINFHSRFHAKYREYEYYIMYQNYPILQKRAWFNNKTLDLDKMQHAMLQFIGTKDFADFTKDKQNTIRTMIKAKVDYEIVFNIQCIKIIFGANAFLHNQVRRMVYFLHAIGHDHNAPIDIQEAIKYKPDITKTPAPAHGLYLSDIKY